MDTAGLTILSERGRGGHTFSHFGICEGCEPEAVATLVKLLDSGHEIDLMNDRDESGEGVTTFRWTATGYQTMDSGHGWQGEWRSIDDVGLRKAMIGLAPLNKGDHCSAQGLIRSPTHT